MITIRMMKIEEAELIRSLDRSELIEATYRCVGGRLEETRVQIDCPNWTESQFDTIIARFHRDVEGDGVAFGAFEGERLAGFAVLEGRFRGERLDRLQLDLMYVSRQYRRQGVGTRVMEEIKAEAKRRGADYLYISAADTESAVNFYQRSGSRLTEEIDEELFQLEPKDIHMELKL